MNLILLAYMSTKTHIHMTIEVDSSVPIPEVNSAITWKNQVKNIALSLVSPGCEAQM